MAGREFRYPEPNGRIAAVAPKTGFDPTETSPSRYCCAAQQSPSMPTMW